MLLRVIVDTPEQFQEWINQQKRTQPELDAQDAALAQQQETRANVLPVAVAQKSQSKMTEGGTENAPDAKYGQYVFEHQACISCHAVAGTVANGRFGPDLTHLMSRDTLAAGATTNDEENLEMWIANPNIFKPGSLMPAMHLSDRENAAITAYLLTLK